MFFIYIMLTATSRADPDCSFIEIPGFETRGASIQTLDQLDLGVCYAYTAAALADSFAFRVQGERDGFITDPIEPALQKSIVSSRIFKESQLMIEGVNHSERLWFEGDSVCRAFDSILKLGRCSIDSSRSLRDPEVIKTMRQIQTGLFEHDHEEGESRLKCSLKASKGMPLSRFLNEVIYAKAIRDKLEENCDRNGRRPLNNVKCMERSPSKLEVKIDVVDNLLDSQRPAVIDYCSRFLRTGTKNMALTRGQPNCGRHASLVVGRKKDPVSGRCMYKLRNSWGRDVCQRYHSSLNPMDRCDANGDLWIDRELLMKTTTSIYFLNR